MWKNYFQLFGHGWVVIFFYATADRVNEPNLAQLQIGAVW
jgi:hypothetical protein